MTANEQKVKDWCTKHIGDGYVWGATGYTLTQSKLNELIGQYPDNVSQSKNGKWLGKTVWDCATFVRNAMKQVGISMVSGATSQWKKTAWLQKGTIDTLPRNKICCLYRQTGGSTMQHTGVYQGDGTFIDARGSSSGVVKNDLGSYPWTHWGIPVGLYKNNELNDVEQEVLTVLYKAKVVVSSGSTVNMRTGPGKGYGRIDAVPKDSIVEVVEEGNEWNKIVWENQTGYMMSEYLQKVEEVKGEYYVRIKCESAAEAKRLAQLLAGATAD